MIRQVLQSLSIAHGIAAVIAAATYFSIWKRSSFWFPRYAHVLALVGLVIGIGIVASMPPDAPAAHAGVVGQTFALLVCPALVYFFFVFYGGQAAALRR